MKSLSLIRLKNLATQPGPKQYLVFDELARRYRDDPSTWIPDPSDPPTGCPRAPNVYEAEWVLLKWSQHLNDEENYELKREQDVRLGELERRLDQDPDSLEIRTKYFSAIGEELRRQR